MASVIIGNRVAAPLLAAVLFGGAVVAACTGDPVLWWAVPSAVCAFAAGRQPGRSPGAPVALAAVLVAAVVAVLLVPAWLGLASRFVGLLLVGAMLPWFAGRFLRQYRELVRAGWERAAQLEREQRLVSEQARLRERTRIAQDMHDLLGHDLSLIALSAGALKLSPGLSEEGRAAAGDVRARAGAAVERLGEVIGVLRGPSEYGPEPGSGSSGGGAGLPALQGLVERAAAAGLDVRLRVEGDPEGADGAASAGRAAVQRVVQEALTNVARHAPGHRATVVVRYGDGRTDVAVTDELGPRAAAAAAVPAAGPFPGGGGHGFGLIGLHERVRLAGGTFSAGPDGAGFSVRAALPHATGSAAAPERAADGRGGTGGSGGVDVLGTRLPAEHRTASRRLGRTAAAAVLVPLCTAAVLIGAVRAWDVATARRSVLDRQDYARLRVGQPRAEVAPYLPERQTTHRPAAPTPAPRDAACEFYVQTADPFDDRSGDLYRLCFRAGHLVSADTYTGNDVR
ncbi:sensor histidine kinase [Streptomyces sp. NPDC090445]|uniref:sensor histidine kinase n=1 Tax=Streptomyces sp. NPDC090445 TaxID=3365963 RepID=UPI0038096AE9